MHRSLNHIIQLGFNFFFVLNSNELDSMVIIVEIAAFQAQAIKFTLQ